MARGKRLTEEEEKQIVLMHTEKKLSQAQISARVGMTPGGVAGVLHRNGIRSRSYGGKGGKYKVPEAERAEAVRMYAEGDGCEKVAPLFGVTSGAVLHWVRAAGIPVRPKGFQRYSDHHQWKGGVIKTSQGYIQELVRPEDPYYEMGQKKVGGMRYVPQHRLVVARSLGRPLETNETVHHVDGNRANNDISNLQLRQGRHGKGAAHVCADCGSHNVVPTHLN